MQFLPKAVKDYLEKIELGTILGPFDAIDCPTFHCSPLLSRQKDDNKRCITFNLSYPTGTSVNDKLNTEGKVTLAKINKSTKFRNLHGNPVDTFKLGIKWDNNSRLMISVPSAEFIALRTFR